MPSHALSSTSAAGWYYGDLLVDHGLHRHPVDLCERPHATIPTSPVAFVTTAGSYTPPTGNVAAVQFTVPAYQLSALMTASRSR